MGVLIFCNQIVRHQWTKIFLKHAVEDFISADQVLLLTQNHELHLIDIDQRIRPAATSQSPCGPVKKIGWNEHSFNEPDITYFLTFQDELNVIARDQIRLLATNLSHLLESTYYDNGARYGIDQIYYVVDSRQLERYRSDCCGPTFELEFDCITSIHYSQNSIYINDVCCLGTGDNLVHVGKCVCQKDIGHQKNIVMHDDLTRILTFRDSPDVIHHSEDNILNVFIEEDVLYYIKTPVKLLLPKS